MRFFLVMQKCFNKFVERNRERHGVWRRSGMRGMTHEVLAKAERAYMDVFVAREVPDEDHFEDVVNYAIFALILLNDWERASSSEEGRGLYQDRIKKFMHGEWPR